MCESNWARARIADIAAPTGRSIVIGPFGSALKAEVYAPSGVPVVRGQDVTGSKHLAEKDRVYVPLEVAARFPACIARSGDLVFPHRGAIGRVGLIGDEEMLLSSSMMKLTVDRARVDPLFVFYYFLGPGRSELLARASTVGTPGIAQPLKSLRQIPISFPGLVQQRGIARVLGALDDKIVANARACRASMELAKAIFWREQRAASWERVALGDAHAIGWLQLGDGYRTKRKEHGEPGLRILRAGDVAGDSIYPTGKDFVSAQFRASIGPKASQSGDVVLTTKGTVGRVAVVPAGMEQVVYSPQLCYFRVLDPTHLAPGFLAAWFRSDDLRRQAEIRMFKSDMAPYINLKDIQSMTIPLAPPADQHRIGESQSALEQNVHAVLHENSVLARTRDELLPLLMSGKVRVRDAERIASERL